MPTNFASIPETLLSTPQDTTVTCGSGLTVKDRVNGNTMVLDNAGNVTFSGTMSSSGTVNGQLTTAAGITASTTQTQGNGPLTKQNNILGTVANTNDTVTLPVAVAGKVCAVWNAGANTAKVFPASGADLGAGADTAITLAAGAKALFIAESATVWHRFI